MEPVMEFALSLIKFRIRVSLPCTPTPANLLLLMPSSPYMLIQSTRLAATVGATNLNWTEWTVSADPMASGSQYRFVHSDVDPKDRGRIGDSIESGELIVSGGTRTVPSSGSPSSSPNRASTSPSSPTTSPASPSSTTFSDPVEAITPGASANPAEQNLLSSRGTRQSV